MPLVRGDVIRPRWRGAGAMVSHSAQPRTGPGDTSALAELAVLIQSGLVGSVAPRDALEKIAVVPSSRRQPVTPSALAPALSQNHTAPR